MLSDAGSLTGGPIQIISGSGTNDVDGSVQNQSGASAAMSSGPQQHLIQQLEQCKYLQEIALIIETGDSYGQGGYFVLYVLYVVGCLSCRIACTALLRVDVATVVVATLIVATVVCRCCC